MRVALLVVAATGVADAQPQDPYPAPPPAAPDPYPAPLQPAPAPTPAPTAPPPAPFTPVLTGNAPALDPDEAWLLQHGEITDAQHYGGGFANVFVGFGLGQAIQHRWFKRGWMFTVGEGAALILMVAGVFTGEDCFDATGPCTEKHRLADIGFFGLLGFHIWGAIDAFYVPPGHNRRVRELRTRLGIPQPIYTRVMPYVIRSRDGGGTAGLSLRF